MARKLRLEYAGGCYQEKSMGSLVRSYTWGLDIVGSLSRAGGVGALLQIADHGSGKTYYPTYDGNGNVAALLNADTGALAAAYEYGPFGEALRLQTVDPTVADQPFKFSTKFTDGETGLVYYGHRYYDPRNGRFINRDPIEESGGLNLYGFAGNNGANGWDYLGMNPLNTRLYMWDDFMGWTMTSEGAELMGRNQDPDIVKRDPYVVNGNNSYWTDPAEMNAEYALNQLLADSFGGGVPAMDPGQILSNVPGSLGGTATAPRPTGPTAPTTPPPAKNNNSNDKDYVITDIPWAKPDQKEGDDDGSQVPVDTPFADDSIIVVMKDGTTLVIPNTSGTASLRASITAAVGAVTMAPPAFFPPTTAAPPSALPGIVRTVFGGLARGALALADGLLAPVGAILMLTPTTMGNGEIRPTFDPATDTFTLPITWDATKAPGIPSAGEGFVPKKNWDGEKVKSPNGSGYGYPDAGGNVWVPTGTGSQAHGGPHWDVQQPGGGYRNVYPGGKVR